MRGASHSSTMYKGVWVIVVCALLFVPPVFIYKMKATKNQKDSTNFLSTPITSKSVQPPIVKTVSEKTIEYRMYGRVVQVNKETSDGITVTFVLDADPVQTVLAGFVRPQEKEYKLVRYDANFEQKLALDRVSGAELTVQALSSPRSLEFGLIFPKAGLSADDESRMRDLDSIIRGNWKSLPTHRLMISFIGVKARM
ncbi:hypothetical protein KBC80_02740 [Candidatus Woesebacteria bacterium]|nr:hypothetical protein [Candidatus Woesebacteria bacterium]